MSRHNPKKKQKQIIFSKKKKKNPYANKTHDYEMTINDNKENLRQKSYRLSVTNRLMMKVH